MQLTAKALRSKSTGKIIIVFPIPGSEFEVPDYGLIDITISDYTERAQSFLEEAVNELFAILDHKIKADSAARQRGSDRALLGDIERKQILEMLETAKSLLKKFQ